LASAALGVPVRAGSTHVELIPKPLLTVNDVAIGDDGAVKVQRIALGVPLSVLWQTPAEFESVHLDQARVPVAVLLEALHAGSAKIPMKAGALTTSGLQVIAEAKPLLPPMDLEARFQDGLLARIAGTGQSDDFGKATLDAQRGAGFWQVSLGAQRFLLPLGFDMPLSDLTLGARLTPDSLSFTDAKAWNSEGELTASGAVSWSRGWKLTAKVKAKRVNVAKFAPNWMSGGFMDGQAELASEAATAAELYARGRMQGRATLGRGVLVGVDLDRVVQGRGVGDQYTFEALEGNVLLDARRYDFTDIRLSAGELAATGAFGIAPDGAVRGRFAVEVKAARMRLTGGVAVSGTAAKPQYQR